jgi:hypothetical protein
VTPGAGACDLTGEAAGLEVPVAGGNFDAEAVTVTKTVSVTVTTPLFPGLEDGPAPGRLVMVGISGSPEALGADGLGA